MFSNIDARIFQKYPFVFNWFQYFKNKVVTLSTNPQISMNCSFYITDRMTSECVPSSFGNAMRTDLTPGLWHLESGTWSLAPRIWHLRNATQNLAHENLAPENLTPRIWHLGCGTWDQAPGFLAPGILHLEARNIWDLAPRTEQFHQNLL